jgi:hypothetical protein
MKVLMGSSSTVWWFFLTPLKNDGLRQLGSLFPTEWKHKAVKHVPVTTNLIFR